MSDEPKVFDLGDDILVIGKAPTPEMMAALKNIGDNELAIVINVKELIGFVPSKEDYEMACEKCGSDSCNCGTVEVQIIAPPEEAPAPDNEAYIFHGIGHQTQEETVHMTPDEYAEYVKLEEEKK